MSSTEAIAKSIPFDTHRLDKLMEEAGLDVIVATSKHNVQYLLGGYRFFFFDSMDAMGVSRYLSAVVYQRGRPDDTAYVGCVMEGGEKVLGKFWTPKVELGSVGSQATMDNVAKHIGKLGGVRRIGIETAFLPTDASERLRRGLANAEVVDATFPLERLRACKTPQEVAYLREASERVVEAMKVTFERHCVPGATKAEVVEALRREEVSRGLVFDYCLITAGTSLNRSPSEQTIEKGDIMTIDSGGNWKGYIGDLCRMGIVQATPDSELQDLLGLVEEVQQAVRNPIRPGARGGDICEIAESLLDASPHRKYTHFMAHGMGLVSHEAPRLMDSPRFSYDGYDKERPLEAGHVISIETTMSHPKRGFVKLEDTIIVTADGYEAVGDGVRGFTPAGV
ncbi:MAG: M24 family metallopeptidase [Hyphomicrobiaceae bacterium]